MYSYFISFAHGSCDEEKRLKAAGKSQMQFLADAVLKMVAPDASFHIVSSSAPRSRESAEAFAVALGFDSQVEAIEYLWAASDAPKGTFETEGDYKKLSAIIDNRKDTASVLIFVTHMGFAEQLANIASGIPDRYRLVRGEAMVYDVDMRQLFRLAP